jgi:glucoamylase
MRRKNVFKGVALGAVLAFTLPALAQSQPSDAPGLAASDGPGGPASWTTGNKLAVGASATADSRVWFTVAKGVTSEIFYPRLDVPNLQDTQYVITDGSTFVELERDATNRAISMPSEKALEYTVTKALSQQR